MSLEIISLDRAPKPELKGAVVALVELDSVHRGHQRQIASAATVARQLGAPLAVVSFGSPDVGSETGRLTTPNQQARMLDSLGVDLFATLPFGVEMTGVSVQVLTRDLLADTLAARHVMIGADLADRLCERFAAPVQEGCHGYTVSIIHQRRGDDAEPYACAAVRSALKAGRMELAQQIMGRPFAIEGVVVEGQKLGRLLGFPTANVSAGDYALPRLGAYATISRLGDGRELPGVANFGVNPTTGLVDARLEVWLFDFDEDIYGRTLETDLIAFLRPELKFDGLAALIDQIAKDADDARAILSPQRLRARG